MYTNILSAYHIPCLFNTKTTYAKNYDFKYTITQFDHNLPHSQALASCLYIFFELFLYIMPLLFSVYISIVVKFIDINEMSYLYSWC